MNIDADFTATSVSIYVDGSVDIVAGRCDLTNTSLHITENLTVSNKVVFVPYAFNGSALSIGGDCALNGTHNFMLNLVATKPWTLYVGGTGTASHVKVSHSDASSSPRKIEAINSCIDMGHNSYWKFVLDSCDRGFFCRKEVCYEMQYLNNAYVPGITPCRQNKRVAN